MKQAREQVFALSVVNCDANSLPALTLFSQQGADKASHRTAHAGVEPGFCRKMAASSVEPERAILK
jgi:hypothetical protein